MPTSILNDHWVLADREGHVRLAVLHADCEHTIDGVARWIFEEVTGIHPLAGHAAPDCLFQVTRHRHFVSASIEGSVHW
jgi:hypothetical protein